MKKTVLSLTLALGGAAAHAENLRDLDKRTQNAVRALDEVLSGPRSVPQKLLAHARCVAVLPEVVEAGFVIVVRTGKGLVSCRTPQGWSEPSLVTLSGGGLGLIGGGKVSDVVLVFTGERVKDTLLDGKFELGANAGLVVGPIGEDFEGGSDIEHESRIYTYARATGVFGGVSLRGSNFNHDHGNMRKVYGDYADDDVTELGKVRELLNSAAPAPAAVRAFQTALGMRLP